MKIECRWVLNIIRKNKKRDQKIEVFWMDAQKTISEWDPKIKISLILIRKRIQQHDYYKGLAES